MRLPLCQISATLIPSVPTNVTLSSDPFIANQHLHPSACTVVWLFIVLFWQHRSVLTPKSILSVVASGLRRWITADWHLARRQRPSAVEFFSSQWMPPGGVSRLCYCKSDGSLVICLSRYFRLPP
jgi:hypothetical protein